MATVSKPRHHTDREAGFSLLELVVAVSIMLILGVVGFVAYQEYTDSARTAAVEASASEVLTAVVAAHNTPNGDPLREVEQYNNTSQDISVNIATADASQLVMTATSCSGATGSASISGNFSALPTTDYTNFTYEWLGEEHRSHAIQKDCDGNVISTNKVTTPRASFDHWATTFHNSTPQFGAWEDGYGAKIVYANRPSGDHTYRDIGARFRVQDNMPRNKTVTVGFDAMSVKPQSTVTVYLFSEAQGYHASETFTVTDKRQRFVTQLTSDTNWSRVAIEFDNDGSYAFGDTVGYVDRLLVEEGETSGTYYDGDGL